MDKKKSTNQVFVSIWHFLFWHLMAYYNLAGLILSHVHEYAKKKKSQTQNKSISCNFNCDICPKAPVSIEFPVVWGCWGCIIRRTLAYFPCHLRLKLLYPPAKRHGTNMICPLTQCLSQPRTLVTDAGLSFRRDNDGLLAMITCGAFVKRSSRCHLHVCVSGTRLGISW